MPIPGLDDEASGNKEQEVKAPIRRIIGPSDDLPTGYLSTSQVSMYMRCPKQYEFRYVKGVKLPPNRAICLGSSVHSATELAHTRLLNTGEVVGEDELLSAFSDAWDENLDKYAIDKAELAGLDATDIDVKDVGVKVVKTYREKRLPEVKPHKIEQRVYDEISGVPFVGYVDLIELEPSGIPEVDKFVCACSDGESECTNSMVCRLQKSNQTIVDTKVVKKAKPQSATDNSLQLTAYSALTGVRKVGFDSLVKSKHKPKVVTTRAERSVRDVVWFGNIVTEINDAILKGSFPPCNPEDWGCSEQWCGYWHLCRGKK